MPQEQSPLPRRITLDLEVKSTVPVPDLPGVFKTTLGSPKLNGELWFTHGEKDRDEILRLKDESLLTEAITLLGHITELNKTSWKKQKPK